MASRQHLPNPVAWWLAGPVRRAEKERRARRRPEGYQPGELAELLGAYYRRVMFILVGASFGGGFAVLLVDLLV